MAITYCWGYGWWGWNGWYGWLATRVYVARFLPVWTRVLVVTHPGTSGSVRSLLSITLRDRFQPLRRAEPHLFCSDMHFVKFKRSQNKIYIYMYFDCIYLFEI